MIIYYYIKKFTSFITIAVTLLTFCALPVWADSRSATVRISCTVAPMLEMTRNSTMAARETQIERAGQKIKLVSFTAL